jgi:hypothetical protein
VYDAGAGNADIDYLWWWTLLCRPSEWETIMPNVNFFGFEQARACLVADRYPTLDELAKRRAA